MNKDFNAIRQIFFDLESYVQFTCHGDIGLNDRKL
jgi:hypothetical protein